MLISLIGLVYAELHNQSSTHWIAIFVLSTVTSETTRDGKIKSLWKEYGFTYRLWLVTMIGLMLFYVIVLVFR